MLRDRAPWGNWSHPNLHKEVSLICIPSTTYPFVISKRTETTVNQVTDEVLFTGLLEMQELDAPGKIPRGRTRLYPHLHKVVSRVFILILKIPSILTLC